VAARGQAALGAPARRAAPAGAALAPQARQGGQAPPRGRALERGARQRRLRGLPGAGSDAQRPAAGGAHSPPKPYTPPATPEGRINTTDPDSHVVKGLRGFIQGYNAQAVTNEHQVVLAAEVMTAGGDFGHLEPMLDATRRELKAIGAEETPSVVLADAGYWHQQQMEAIVDRGMQVLIPPDASKRKGSRPGWDGGLYAFMRRVLSSDHGGGLYAKRRGMIEPVFAQTKHNRGMTRFHRRGRAAVRAEWRLITATHNLLG
jgi:hypothetical protein